MNLKNPLVRTLATILVAVVLIVGWFLVSPLFIDRTVDEAFPFALPSESEIAAMDAETRADLEQQFFAAIPDDEAMADMTDEQMAELTERVETAAVAVMADRSADDDAMEDVWQVAAQGSFVDADSFHRGSGSATIFEQGGERVLRLEDFSVTNGPDLHVILTRDPAPASRGDVGSDYIDLGSLKGNMGNQNYEVPADIDLSEYRGVVIYCMPFHVVFATASLN
jgi:hypothetical protein